MTESCSAEEYLSEDVLRHLYYDEQLDSRDLQGLDNDTDRFCNFDHEFGPCIGMATISADHEPVLAAHGLDYNTGGHEPVLPEHALQYEVPSLNDCITDTNILVKEGTNIGSSSQRIPDATKNIVTEEGTDGSGSQRASWNDPQRTFLLKKLLEFRTAQRGGSSSYNWDQIAPAMKEKFGNSPNFQKKKLQQKKCDLRRKYKRIKGKHSDSPNKDIPPYYDELVALFEEGPMVEADAEPAKQDSFSKRKSGAAKSYSTMTHCINMFNALEGFPTIDKTSDISHVVRIFKVKSHRQAFVAMKKDQKIIWLESMVDIFKRG